MKCEREFSSRISRFSPQELANLIKYVLRKFFAAVETNNALFIELLFFKSVREGFEAVQGYGTFENTKKSSKWNPELDDEVVKLFEAYRNDPVPKGRDLADVILHQLSDQTKTRRQLVARLIFLNIITSAKELKMLTVRENLPKRSTRAINEDDAAEWTEDEIMRLRSAVDEHQGSRTMLTDVMNSLIVDRDLAVKRKQDLAESETPEHSEEVIIPPLRSRRVVAAKLLELGFVDDRKALGRNPRNRNHRLNAARRGALNIDLDTSGAGKPPPRKRRRRKHSDSNSDELHFPEDDVNADGNSEETEEEEQESERDENEAEKNPRIYETADSSDSSGEDSSVNLPIRPLALESDLPLRRRVRLSDSESNSDIERPLQIVANNANGHSDLDEHGSTITDSNRLQTSGARLRLDSQSSADEQSVEHTNLIFNEQHTGLVVAAQKRRVVLSSDSED
ncbi:unnamed protein product [Echinostoma caproni]|uniref:TIMELESS_C domain-containing protein n=1 Tax=Echinostoma caproni TaxID=27848 RepID=A0A3P8HN64_9TREM|nr:unnamed protein product [Echinostoma caproni]